jgi:hypothetical protein
MTTRDGTDSREPVFTPPDPDGDALVTCWCEDTRVMVPVRDIRAGRTRSCGEVWCHQ